MVVRKSALITESYRWITQVEVLTMVWDVPKEPLGWGSQQSVVWIPTSDGK